MSGWNKIENRLVTYILENEPLGTYSLATNQIDFAVAYGTIDAIDFNLDGLQDLVIAGANSVTLYAERCILYWERSTLIMEMVPLNRSSK